MGERPVNKMFADWELAIPNIHGVFSTRRGWITSKGADPTRRCSEYWWPYSESVIGEGAPSNQNFTKTFLPEEFWFGAYLYTPDSGDIPVLRTHTYAGVDNGWPRPSNGGSYPLRTRGGAVIRCVPSQDGSSEGFEVTTQDGTSYRLDHLATRPMYPLLKFQDFSGAGSQYRMQWTLPRTEYFLLVTSVKDRFGNTVSYEWDQADPWKLNRITGSDGRALNITYSNGVISQVQDANKPDQIWKYNGGSVIRPDGSSWEFSSLDLNSNSYGEGSIPGKNSICYSPGYPTTKKMRAIMKHPSGAIATFEAEAVLHGRSRTRNTCDTAYNPNSSYWLQSSERNPATYYLWSIKSKTISGPGISSPLVWTYNFSSPGGCYEPANPAGINTCSSTSPYTKWVDVLGPDGNNIRYVYGNVFDVNEGILLEQIQDGRRTTFIYDDTSTGAYPHVAGTPAHPDRSISWSDIKVTPLREKTIVQDGQTFRWRVNQFDGQARPISVTSESSPWPQ